MSANVLIIGSGGREHAIVWKLSQSAIVKNIFAAPGSQAIQQVTKTTNVTIDIRNFEEVTSWCKQNCIDLVVVGPEDPLANGIANRLVSVGINVFGPQKDGARIESDKNWAKYFMDKYHIPTAKWASFTNSNEAKKFIKEASFRALVVKASGLAAGKGVIVAENKEEACRAVDEILTDKKFGSAGETVVIEELLEGEEVSVLAFCDGTTISAMLPSQDHKRIFDDDKGPNTGGMGAYCPCPLLDSDQFNYVKENILQVTVNGLIKENIKYVGVLYAGLMLTTDGPKVLEFNCRFGDPETEVILPLLVSDLYLTMVACCMGTLATTELKWINNMSAVGVVMASKGYPETSSKGQVITGIDEVNKLKNYVVFHCGTALENDKIVTNGGRVVIIVSLAPLLPLAASLANNACKMIKFDGQQFRKDIAHKGIARSILESGILTYKTSGVDITAGDNLINLIKPLVSQTNRNGVVSTLGGFGGIFDAKQAGFIEPLLVSGTDGVGTKLKIAQEMNMHDTIGIDLVAMCVNDVLAHGAEPLFFLDYFACGKLDVNVAKNVIAGVVEGCSEANCTLIGGETAEMPDMYPVGEYDIAGFAVGAVERNNLLPQIDKIKVGDVIIGLPSTGVHSNGFSLVRKVMQLSRSNFKDVAPFSKNGKSFGEEFLTPTKIYVRDVIPVIKRSLVKAFAHITGGGLIENIPRILPRKVEAQLDSLSWNIPPVFAWMAAVGGINEFELLRTFNCGIGAILVVAKEHEVDVLHLLKESNARTIGKINNQSKDDRQVLVNNFMAKMEKIMKQFIPQIISIHSRPKKKVGVLISGSGTNLQALIDTTINPLQQIGAEIVLVISNKPDVEGLKRAERANIPTKVIKHKDYPNRVEFDNAMNAELEAAGVELVCLAGFMRILSEEFTIKWKGRLLNIHPALLPLFKGTHAQKQAIEAGVCVTGCSVHFVEADVDAGAIIVQETVPVYPNDTEEILTERIKTVEHKAYPLALKLVATGKVRLGNNNKLVWI